MSSLTDPRRTRSCLVLVLPGAAIFAALACGSPSPPPPLVIATGPDAEVTVEGLQRVRTDRLDLAYVKPTADFGRYSKFIIERPSIFYKWPPRTGRYNRTASNYALTPQQMERLKQLFYEEFAKEIERGDEYAVVESPGRDVLTLEVEIVDLVVRVPTQQTPGQSATYVASLGSMTLVLEARDSVTGEILARVADRKEVRRMGGGELYWSAPATNEADVRRAFRAWARILRSRLDQMHALPATPEPERA